MNEVPTPPSAPPLPHLVGPVPVPPNVKRGRIAFWLSAGSWMLFAGGFGIFIYIAATNSKTAVWVSAAETTGILMFLISPVFSVTGAILGIMTRTQRAGVAAIIMGAANVVTWAALVTAAVWSTIGKR